MPRAPPTCAMALSLHLPYNISRLYQLTTPHFRLHQLTSYMHSLRARASKAGRRARAERQRTASDASPSPFIPCDGTDGPHSASHRGESDSAPPQATDRTTTLFQPLPSPTSARRAGQARTVLSQFIASFCTACATAAARVRESNLGRTSLRQAGQPTPHHSPTLPRAARDATVRCANSRRRTGSTFSSLISSQRLLCDYTQNPATPWHKADQHTTRA